MVVSTETMVGLGLHVLSDCFGGIASVPYKVNSLLILLLLQVLHVHTLYHMWENFGGVKYWRMG